MKLENQLRRAMQYHRTHPCTKCAHYTPPRDHDLDLSEAPPKCTRNTIAIPVDPDGTCNHFTSRINAKRATAQEEVFHTTLQRIAAGNLDGETYEQFAERCVHNARTALDEKPNANVSVGVPPPADPTCPQAKPKEE